MATIALPNNWRPRDDQLPLWLYLEAGGQNAVEVAHRRWGKDDVALHHTACAAMTRPGNYWHMLPQYKQARKAIWDAVNPRTGKRRIDEAFPHEIRNNTKDQEMIIHLKSGSTWQLVGSDNFDTLVGSPPVGLVHSEYALADPRAQALLKPILLENQGWQLFIYTPRGTNHGKRMLDFARTEPGWFAQCLTADQTPVFTKEQLATVRRELIMNFGDAEGEALFQQEYFCSFQGAVLGAYFAKQLARARADGRICSVPYAAGCEVYTFWDLGFDDSTTIWFMQLVGRELRFIDYYENTGEGMEHYAKEIKGKHYVYGDHFMPHDAGKHELGTGKSIKDTAEALGIRPITVVKRPRDSEAVRAGIEASRNILSQCWFDEVKCSRGLSALDGYSADYDEDKKKLSNKPRHDWTSHGADAFRTFAVGFAPPVKRRTVASIMQSVSLRSSW